MNDINRQQWVDNDEGLYLLWKSSGQGQHRWIRENRNLIDETSGEVKSGRQSAHYLRYGKEEYGRIH